jgi:subtilisin family serine protease
MRAHPLLAALALSFTSACAVPVDTLALVTPGIQPHVEHPELSVLPDGTTQQRWLVQLRADLFEEGYLALVAGDLVSSEGVQIEAVYDVVYGGFAAPLTSLQVSRLRARPEVAAVVPDQRLEAVKGPPTSSSPPPSDWALVDVMGAAWAGTTNGGSGASVAVLDTGVDSDHPSLPSSSCIGNYSSDTTGCEDGHGHGTHVAGTIVALSSSSSGNLHRGVAPGAALGVAKVLSASGSGSTSGIVAAINDTAGVWDVLNMSLGGSAWGSEETDPLCIAIANAASLGTVSAVAAGNDGRDAARSTPARCDAAMTVAAYDATNTLASFTNWGDDVDVSAPGVSIYSTTIGGGFGRKSGTSMASPHAAGVAALFIAANPGAAAADVIDGVIALSADRGSATRYSRRISIEAPMLDGRDY